MAKLSYKKKKSFPAATYGLPGEKKYPMPDKAHSINAKARASQQVKKGNLSKAEYSKIVSKANAKIKAAGGKVGKPAMKKRGK
jgi:hypothetical protein